MKKLLIGLLVITSINSFASDVKETLSCSSSAGSSLYGDLSFSLTRSESGDTALIKDLTFPGLIDSLGTGPSTRPSYSESLTAKIVDQNSSGEYIIIKDELSDMANVMIVLVKDYDENEYSAIISVTTDGPISSETYKCSLK